MTDQPLTLEQTAKRRRRAAASRTRMKAAGYTPCPLCGRYLKPPNRCVNCGAEIK